VGEAPSSLGVRSGGVGLEGNRNGNKGNVPVVIKEGNGKAKEKGKDPSSLGFPVVIRTSMVSTACFAFATVPSSAAIAEDGTTEDKGEGSASGR